MGRNFVGVFCVAPDALEAIVGSKSDAKYAALLAADKDSYVENAAAAYRRIVDGDFSPGEQPDGALSSMPSKTSVVPAQPTGPEWKSG